MAISESARRLKSLRSRAIGLRELARLIQWEPSRYQYYEDQYKKPYLPRDLVERIKPHIIGKGDPPVTSPEIDALAGSFPPPPQIESDDVRGSVVDANITPPLRSEMLRDIPILGTVSAGGGSLHMNGEPIDWARRPPRLRGRTDVFGLYVEDLSMVPAYRPGSLILVERARPPSPGDDVVLELRPASPREDQRALIKHLLALTPKLVRLEQYNPHKLLEFDRKQVIHLYRVMPLNDLLGV